jgi:4-amino-4-deoxy-L-arabinose transferase-like glycosyltransferase
MNWLSGQTATRGRLNYSSYSAAVSGQVSGATVVRLFLLMLAIKAVIAFLAFPLISQVLGSNYHSDLFPDQYDAIAENLAAGNGYRVFTETAPTMLRSPGFVVLLAGIFFLFGKGILAVQVVQYFMSAGTAIFVYLITNRLVAMPRVSIVASAVYLFHPMVLVSDSRGGVDTMLMLCMTVSTWLLYRAIDRRRISDFVFLGLAFGVTMLVKPSVALILPAVGLFLMLARSIWQSSLVQLIRNFAITGLVAGLVLVPWVVRNYEISGHFVPTMTVGGLALFQGVEVVKHSGENKDHLELLDDAAVEQSRIAHEMGLHIYEGFFPQFYTVDDELKFYNELGRRAWEDYREHPMLLVRAIVHNSWAFWFQGRTEMATILDLFIMVPFLVLSTIGAVSVISREPRGWILVITIVAFMLPHLVIIALARHCSTIIPLLAVLTAGSLPAVIGRRTERPTDRDLRPATFPG